MHGIRTLHEHSCAPGGYWTVSVGAEVVLSCNKAFMTRCVVDDVLLSGSDEVTDEINHPEDRLHQPRKRYL